MRGILLAVAVVFAVVLLVVAFPRTANADGGIDMVGGVNTTEGWIPFKSGTPIRASSAHPVSIVATIYNQRDPGAHFVMKIYGMRSWNVEVSGAADATLVFIPMDSPCWGLWGIEGQFDAGPVDVTVHTTLPPSPNNYWKLYVSARALGEQDPRVQEIRIQNRYWRSLIPSIQR